ncbi:MAG: phenylalanine--tRNA ligase subunit beta [Phycisphaerae bacterium]|nr:phenylalanine--tRNA ligase subunit beta [Phycisphaerae bacterium]MCZ2398910.1 phenylalanine--tRNA ligase subunit beta [Phycisphaerae bacterium]
MPIVNMPVEGLLRLVNRGVAAPLSAEALVERLHDMGVEVEETAETHQFVCRGCGRVLERTDAQGPPAHCASCGTDFRADAGALHDAGRLSVLRLNLLAVRPDIFDVGGMARYARGFLGVQPGLIDYPVAPPALTVKVDPRLSEDSSRRPYIACAVLRKVRLDHERIKFLMNLQEDLHWALGRDRKLASIGMYDLDKLSGASFSYDAVRPDELRFVPLGFDARRADSLLTPAQILERHKTGQAYAHLLRGYTRYPLLRDERGTVLSMPPIINSEATRVTQQTRQCFVDVTGLSQRTVDRALAIVVTSAREVLPGVEIEQVAIAAPDGRRDTPDLAPGVMSLSVREASETIGVRLTSEQAAGLLERMGHGVRRESQETLQVRVPAWRNDVMHAVDLVEDVAIALGYDHLSPAIVPTVTIAAAREIEERSAVVRRIMTGLGFHQVMTLTLSSEPAAFDRWLLAADDPLRERAVRIENPISVEQTICRAWLLPGLLETFAINKRYDLPQWLFEVGDVSSVDPSAETGAREERRVSAAMIGTHVGYADIRAVCDALAHELSAAIDVRPAAHPGFIAGRAASVHDAQGAALGVMGELHPQVIENYGLKHPVVALELALAPLLRLQQ